MARRDVDSTVLRELAAATVRARGDIERQFSSANNRVNSAPGGWDRGRWDGVPSFIRMELETMDREQRELMERAIKVDLVAAVTALPDGVPLSAWKFLVATIGGPAFAFFLAPGVVEGFVAKVSEFSTDFQAKNGKAPSVDDLKLWVGNTIGGIGLVLGARKVTETPEVTGGNRYHGRVVVSGKTLTDDELFDRAKGINRAYRDVLGRAPTHEEYDAAMRSGRTTEEIRADITPMKVEYQSQWRGSDGGNNCGPASVVMAASALGVKLDYQATVNAMRNLDDEESNNDNRGGYTRFSDFTPILDREGLVASGVTSVSAVTSALKQKQPVIMRVDTTEWTEVPYITQDNPSGYRGAHIVVVTGIDNDYVYVNDPLATKAGPNGTTVADPERGNGFKVPREEFLRSAGGEGNFEARAVSKAP